MRWTWLTVAGLVLTLPYARPERVGAGDAQDYAEHLADFLEQTHHGVFPVLVGQSHYAFNGSFNPLRTAPYFEYVGGVLHLLTMGTMGPYALQNLMIVLSFIAAAFSAYLCLQRLWPAQGWLCCLLAVLALSSPGVLALAYGGDMVPSWLTLPYLPICAYLLGRSGGRRHHRAPPGDPGHGHGGHLAGPRAHRHVAFPDCDARARLSPGRFPSGNQGSRTQLALATADLVFAALAGYVFVSVAELRLPTLPLLTKVYYDGSVFETLREGWRGFLATRERRGRESHRRSPAQSGALALRGRFAARLAPCRRRRPHAAGRHPQSRRPARAASPSWRDTSGRWCQPSSSASRTSGPCSDSTRSCRSSLPSPSSWLGAGAGPAALLTRDLAWVLLAGCCLWSGFGGGKNSSAGGLKRSPCRAKSRASPSWGAMPCCRSIPPSCWGRCRGDIIPAASNT